MKIEGRKLTFKAMIDLFEPHERALTPAQRHAVRCLMHEAAAVALQASRRDDARFEIAISWNDESPEGFRFISTAIFADSSAFDVSVTCSVGPSGDITEKQIDATQQTVLYRA